MNTIHHATAKKALDCGIKLSINEDGHLEAGFTLNKRPVELLVTDERSAKDFLADILSFLPMAGNDPKLSVITSEDGDSFIVHNGKESGPAAESLVDSYIAWSEGERESHEGMEDILDGSADAVEEQNGEEEEEGVSHSVVRPVYRQRYRENESKGVNCADGLALQMAKMLHVDGAISIERLDQLCIANDIDFAKYHTGSRGWEGRYRMTVGNILRARIKKGTQVIFPAWPKETETAEPEAPSQEPVNKREQESGQEF